MCGYLRLFDAFFSAEGASGETAWSGHIAEVVLNDISKEGMERAMQKRRMQQGWKAIKVTSDTSDVLNFVVNLGTAKFDIIDGVYFF